MGSLSLRTHRASTAPSLHANLHSRERSRHLVYKRKERGRRIGEERTGGKVVIGSNIEKEMKGGGGVKGKETFHWGLG